MYIGEQQQQRAQKLLNCARAFTLRAYLAKATLFKREKEEHTTKLDPKGQKIEKEKRKKSLLSSLSL